MVLVISPAVVTHDGADGDREAARNAPVEPGSDHCAQHAPGSASETGARSCMIAALEIERRQRRHRADDEYDNAVDDGLGGEHRCSPRHGQQAGSDGAAGVLGVTSVHSAVKPMFITTSSTGDQTVERSDRIFVHSESNNARSRPSDENGCPDGRRRRSGRSSGSTTSFLP